MKNMDKSTTNNMLKSALETMLKRLMRGQVKFLALDNRNSDILRKPVNTPTPMHNHKFVETVVSIEGKACLHLPDRQLSLVPDRLYVILPETAHCERYWKRYQSYAVLWSVITPKGVNFFVHRYTPKMGYYVEDRITSYLLDSEELWNITRSADIRKDVVARALFLSNLMKACLSAIRFMDKTTLYNNDYHEDIVQQIKSYIDLHFTEQIHISELAGMVRRSPNYVNAIFKRHTGRAIKQYLIWTRLNYAHKLLMNTHFQIKKISMLSGFNDPLYFSRLFTKYFGISPKNRRKTKKRI